MGGEGQGPRCPSHCPTSPGPEPSSHSRFICVMPKTANPAQRGDMHICGHLTPQAPTSPALIHWKHRDHVVGTGAQAAQLCRGCRPLHCHLGRDGAGPVGQAGTCQGTGQWMVHPRVPGCPLACPGVPGCAGPGCLHQLAGLCPLTSLGAPPLAGRHRIRYLRGG